MPIVSYTSYDYKSMKVVPVIAYFDTEGHIKPLYVRIESNSYKIHSYWVKSCFVNVSEFHCQVLDGDILRPLVLSYYQSEGIWGIPPP